MSFIVCRSCKKFVEVDEKLPLNFYKCENCGHTLEFAANETELKMILNDITLPEISYNKICASCNSLNPRNRRMFTLWFYKFTFTVQFR